jgi:hypothetical protein
VIVALPVVEAAKETKHTPEGASAQLVGETVPVTPVTVKLTVPLGVEPPGPPVSLTKTTQNVG